MKLLYLFVFFLGGTLVVPAQQLSFVYLQTENKQPFYVKMNDKIYSSSSTGYIVLSKLKPDTYNLQLGFSKNAYPEQTFSVTVEKDAGYLLKNMSDKDWAMYNLQSGETIYNLAAGKPATTAGEDSFSSTLSLVVSSPDLTPSSNEKPRASDSKYEKSEKVEEAKAVSKIPEKKYETAADGTQKSSVIRQLLSKGDKSGRQLVYTDGQDTIRIFIPGEIEADGVVTGNSKNQIIDAKAAEVGKANEIHVNQRADSAIHKQRSTIVNPVSKCEQMAGQDDFLKLRKKMAAEKEEEAMTAVAKKYFKTKCFAVEQIRNLSMLYLTEEGRYRFFDEAYLNVHDVENFAMLEQLLKDEYFRNRFKAMISR